MSTSSKCALRAFRSLQRLNRAQVEALPSRTALPYSRAPVQRTFYTSSQFLAQAAPAPSTPSSTTAGASATETPLNTASLSQPVSLNEADPSRIDWSKSFHGLGNEAFPKEAADVLLAPVNPEIVEIKPDGIIYLPEIHYRRILNRAFGPGAWGLAPRGDTIVTDKAVTREYAMIAHGRLVSIARGEQDYFNKDGIPTASEGCKSNAMMRCCKDLGIASELWDPRFIKSWKAKHAKEVFVEHQVSKKRTKIWMRKEDSVQYPYKETNGASTVRKTMSEPSY